MYNCILKFRSQFTFTNEYFLFVLLMSQVFCQLVWTKSRLIPLNPIKFVPQAATATTVSNPSEKFRIRSVHHTRTQHMVLHATCAFATIARKTFNLPRSMSFVSNSSCVCIIYRNFIAKCISLIGKFYK